MNIYTAMTFFTKAKQVLCINITLVKLQIVLLLPAMKLRQRNVFTPVCYSFHRGGGGLCPGGSLSGGVSVRGGSLSRRASVQGISVLGGSLSRGRVSVQEEGLCHGNPPPPPYGYVWSVRILLECILVFECFYVEMSRHLTCCVAVSSRRCSAVFPFKKLWQCTTNGIVVCI